MSGTASPPFDLEEYLREERPRIDRALGRALDRLDGMLSEVVGGAVRHGVLAGGKRLRPVCCVASYLACTGGRDPGDPLRDLAVSLELIHAYSLMHDDLPCMDDAPLRRGRPTPHTVHGEAATIVGGAALIPGAGLQVVAAGRALGMEGAQVREGLRVLARAAGGGGMVGGQGLDLLGEGRALGKEALDELHTRKTGALLTASLVLGGVAAGADPERRGALERYGQGIGLAFQVADDILDATSDPETLGKAPSDAELEKSTYVRLLGVEGARAEARRLVEDALSGLSVAGLSSPPLRAIARYVVERDH